MGRSTESPIDFVVTDTVSGGQNDEAQITQSTISRFACRIVCDRSEPYTARIFAAGFDSSKNIFLGVSTADPLWSENPPTPVTVASSGRELLCAAAVVRLSKFCLQKPA